LQLINKIKLTMSGLRRNSRSRHEHYEMAIESDPNDLPAYQTHPARRFPDLRAVRTNLGEIVSKEAYLSTLQEEIELLRSRIGKMEEEESERMAWRGASHPADLLENPSQEGAPSQSRKSLAGRIYVRASTPSSTKKALKPAGKDQTSSYYKWRPQIEAG
jgi:hypothetical protein